MKESTEFLTSQSKFRLWLVYLVLIFVFSFYYLQQGLKFETSFFKIFPDHADQGGFYKANSKYENHIINEILGLVVGRDGDKVFTTAELVRDKMFQSKLFKVSGANEASGAAGNSEVPKLIGDRSLGIEGNLWIPFLYKNRKLLLSEEQLHKLELDPKGHFFLQQALQNIYSPMGMGLTVAEDPLNLFSGFLMKTSAIFPFQVERGFLVRKFEDKIGVLLPAQTRNFGFLSQQNLVEFYEDIKSTETQLPVYFLGPQLYSAFGSEKSMAEARSYGAVSFLILIGFLVACFGSFRPIIVTTFTILLSLSAGFLAMAVFFAQIHVLSLLLGISILGVITDYCTHFFSKCFDSNMHSYQEVWHHVRHPLRMGLIVNILTYLCFYFTDLVILQQLAVFTIAGILSTYFTIASLFPRLHFKFKNPGLWDQMAKFSLGGARGVSWKLAIFFSLILVCLFFFKQGQFTFNDDVRLLQTPHRDLKDDESIITQFLGFKRSPSYFIIKGHSVQELLQTEEDFISSLNKKNIAALGISKLVPSYRSQLKSFESYNQLKPTIREFFEEIRSATGFKNYIARENPPNLFEPDDLFGLGDSIPLKSNWLGAVEGNYYSVVNILGDIAPDERRSYSTPQIFGFNKTEDLTFFIESLRTTIMKQFFWVMAFLSLVLIIIYGWQRSLFILLPPLVATMTSALVILLWSGYLNLFNILAMILVFCLGMDYSVFCAQSQTPAPAVRIGLLISLISTIESFGVLSLSSTHAVSTLGLTVFIGICLAYFLAPIASKGAYEK